MCNCSAANSVSFAGTPEQKEQLLQVINDKRNEPGALMPILQKAQEIYGYLPIEVQIICKPRSLWSKKGVMRGKHTKCS